MKTTIWVTTRRAGFHQWGVAPAEVAFLHQTHRHLFHVKVWFPVSHNDRDLEFFMQLKKVELALDKLACSGPYGYALYVGSCEMVCEHLLQELPEATKAEVSEDGESGATMERS